MFRGDNDLLCVCNCYSQSSNSVGLFCKYSSLPFLLHSLYHFLALVLMYYRWPQWNVPAGFSCCSRVMLGSPASDIFCLKCRIPGSTPVNQTQGQGWESSAPCEIFENQCSSLFFLQFLPLRAVTMLKSHSDYGQAFGSHTVEGKICLFPHSRK